ncbi:MAG: hypothetical protein DRJ10_04185 [Bacteroidetes bacterium]|nr:MAG: hypothetical protein DRJ10_04185 [Bacteroidota bacterium]
MKQFTISIPDGKARIFLEFMNSLSFVNQIEEIDYFIVPEEHKKIVRERIRKSEAKPEILLDWDNVKDNFILD